LGNRISTALFVWQGEDRTGDQHQHDDEGLTRVVIAEKLNIGVASVYRVLREG
jgi:hypothetical protein